MIAKALPTLSTSFTRGPNLGWVTGGAGETTAIGLVPVLSHQGGEDLNLPFTIRVTNLVITIVEGMELVPVDDLFRHFSLHRLPLPRYRR